MSLKVTHFSLWNHGGAGIAATRLHEGLRHIGIDSRMCVLSKQGDDPCVEVIPPRHGETSRMGDKLVSPDVQRQFARWGAMQARYPNRVPNLEAFTDSLAQTRLENLQAFRDADIVNLHWVSGVIDFQLDTASFVGKPVVWTMHDMNPFTGGCHYSGGCERYIDQCGCCHLLGSEDPRDASARIWAKKKEAFDRLDLTCVTPSRWLGECAGRSSLWRGRPRHVIPYGLDTGLYKAGNPAAIRERLGIPQDMFLILFGAESAANPRKGFMHVYEALCALRARVGAQGIGLAIFGHCSDELAAALPFDAYRIGFLSRPQDMALAYGMADVCLLPSIEDNLPNVGLESLACGTPVVGFRIGGVPDIVTHMDTGYLAEAGDVAGLCDGMAWVLEQKHAGRPLRQQCRRRALEEFNLLKQANAYVELYETILARRAGRA